MQNTKKLLLVDPTSHRMIDQPLVSSFQTPIKSPLDDRIEEILNSNAPEDEKVKLYSMTLNKYKNFKKAESENDPEAATNALTRSKNFETDLLTSVPTQHSYKAKIILDKLKKKNPEINWSEDGQLIYRQKAIENSNLTELISDALKTKALSTKDTKLLPGWNEFGAALHQADVPLDIIANNKVKQYVKKISQNIDNRDDYKSAAEAIDFLTPSPYKKHKLRRKKPIAWLSQYEDNDVTPTKKPSNIYSALEDSDANSSSGRKFKASASNRKKKHKKI